MNLLTQVTLDRSTRRKDRSVSITFITELEATTDEFMKIDQLNSQSGVLYFKPSGKLTEEELKEIDKVNVKSEGKSPSQRLRNVLFVYCEQQGKDFKEFYPDEMERIIQHYKDKLD